MPLLQWSQSLSVSVKEFDEQHQKLVAMVNLLFDSMKEGKGKEVLSKIFTDLVEYTQVHFKAEEDLMVQYNYPQYIAHRVEHQELTKKALELKGKFESGAMFITVEVLNFLRDWLSNHILGVDHQYSKFFNDKGVN